MDPERALVHARLTPAGWAQYVTRGAWRLAPHLRVLVEAVMWAIGTGGRLLVSMPPRHGKSWTISRFVPGWLAGTYPDKRVLLASYEADFAASWGRQVRRDIEEHGERVFGVRIAGDSSAANRWDVEGHAGGMQTAGVGGPLTGKGANCVVSGTMVETSDGQIRIDDLWLFPSTRKIAAYDEAHGIVWRDQQAFRRSEADRVVRITLASGRVLEATGEHRVYSGGRYVAASELAPGDPVVLAVRCGVRPTGVRGEQVDTEGAARSVLLDRVLAGAPRDQEPAQVREVRVAHSAQDDAVLPGVQARANGQARHLRADSARLPDLSGDLPVALDGATGGEASGVLLADLRGHRALREDGGQGQPEVEAWGDAATAAAALGEGVSPHAAQHHPSGRRGVRGVQGHGQVARSPLGRLAHEQRGDEPSHALREVSQEVARCEGFEAVADVVAVVERVPGRVAVFDIQVAENHNFFANGVLVHNCLIIDDPVKNAEEADSQTYRDRTWDWWASTAYTRLEPGASAIVVMTRWHQDDLAGRILSNDADSWRVLNLPALAESGDPLGREPGAALWPERYDEAALERIRRSVGPRVWSALYQGRPTPDEGGIIKRGWIRHYDALPDVPNLRFVQSWDLTFKETAHGSWVVGQVWAYRPDFGTRWLVDEVRFRGDFVATLEAMDRLSAKHPRATTRLVEEKANGAAILATLKRRGVSGVIPIQVDGKHGSKAARLSSVAPLYEAGDVLYPSPRLAPWIHDHVEEMVSFPTGASDDRCDAASQALSWMAERSGSGAMPVPLSSPARAETVWEGVASGGARRIEWS